MRRPENAGSYKPQERGGDAWLPPGCYVGVIRSAKEQYSMNGAQMLHLECDIAEGEWAGYYGRNFEAQKTRRADPRWRGSLNIMVPPDFDDAHDWRIRQFNNSLYAIEVSNPGYHWDWNEQGLAGKRVGLNIRETEYLARDSAEIRITTEIGRLEPVEDVNSGKAKPMPLRAYSGTRPAATVTQGNTVPAAGTAQAVDEDQLPF